MIPYISYDRLVMYLGDLNIEVLQESLENNLIKTTKYFKLIHTQINKINHKEDQLIKISFIYQLQTKNLTDKEFETNKKVILDEINRTVNNCLKCQSIIFS